MIKIDNINEYSINRTDNLQKLYESLTMQNRLLIDCFR